MAGNYDPNKDYAAAIKNESDPAKKQQLISERQNKIDAMNAAGKNTNGYTNSIYGGGGNSGGNSGGSNGGSNGGNNGFDPTMDYAAAIRNEKDPVRQAQLIQERENKVNWLNQTGQNTGGYTNDIYKGSNSPAGTGTYQPPKEMGVWQNSDAQFQNRGKLPHLRWMP